MLINVFLGVNASNWFILSFCLTDYLWNISWLRLHSSEKLITMELGESGKVSFFKISYLRKSSYLSDLRGIAIQAKQSFFNPLNSFLRKKIQLIFQRLLFLSKKVPILLISYILDLQSLFGIKFRTKTNQPIGELPNLKVFYWNVGLSCAGWNMFRFLSPATR